MSRDVQVSLGAALAATVLAVLIALSGDVFGGLYLGAWALLAIGLSLRWRRVSRSRRPDLKTASTRAIALGLVSLAAGVTILLARPEGMTFVVTCFAGGGALLLLVGVAARRHARRSVR